MLCVLCCMHLKVLKNIKHKLIWDTNNDYKRKHQDLHSTLKYNNGRQSTKLSMVQLNIFQFIQSRIICNSYIWCRLQCNLLCGQNNLNHFAIDFFLSYVYPSSFMLLVLYIRCCKAFSHDRAFCFLGPISEYTLFQYPLKH